MVTDAERTIRLWRAAEMFGPRPLPRPDARDNVTDAVPGEPLPWEPGGRLAGRPAAPGKAWRHQVFGGLFALGKVRGTLTGESGINALVALACRAPVAFLARRSWSG